MKMSRYIKTKYFIIRIYVYIYVFVFIHKYLHSHDLRCISEAEILLSAEKPAEILHFFSRFSSHLRINIAVLQ